MGGHFILKLNNRCNLNCLFCADPLSIRTRADPPLADIIQNIKEQKGKKSLIITGGEPTISPHLMTILKLTRPRFESIAIVTNGLMFSNKAFTQSVELYIDSVQLSFLGDEHTYDGIARVRGSYRKVIAALHMITKEKRINIVIHKLNYCRLEKILQDLSRFTIAAVTLSFMNPVGDSVVNKRSYMGISYSDAMPYLRSVLENTYPFDLFIENVPLCIDMSSYNADLHKPMQNKDYYTEGKIKPQQCDRCGYLAECEGVWRAYHSQFGSHELHPISIEGCKTVDELDDSFFDNYSFEIDGILHADKPGSILYCSENELNSLIPSLDKKGIQYMKSPLLVHTEDEHTLVSEESVSSSSKHKVYISRSEKIRNALCEIDLRYHQEKRKEDLFRIGKLLGYPRCCTAFLQRCHDTYAYERVAEETGYESEDETLYKILALKRSRNVRAELNNFSISYPTYFNFFVCSYQCDAALRFVTKCRQYIKKYISGSSDHEKALRRPMLFFSAYRILTFDVLESEGAGYSYKGFSINTSLLKMVNDKKKKEFIDIVQKISEGDAFRVYPHAIIIYCEGEPVHMIRRKHPYFGIPLQIE